MLQRVCLQPFTLVFFGLAPFRPLLGFMRKISAWELFRFSSRERVPMLLPIFSAISLNFQPLLRNTASLSRSSFVRCVYIIPAYILQQV
ncbi:MAG: hypothetical protein AUJ51_13540 [Elusimicrobia bacterium CG1_02_56_21]|nr:MAG: hypothetical protein AUJ51_13540 [Elusimicrobia bacterium CG1_02_56_21]